MVKVDRAHALVNEWLAPIIDRVIFLIPIHGVTSPRTDSANCACQRLRWGHPDCAQWGKHPVGPWKSTRQLSPVDCRRILEEYRSNTGVLCNWAFKLGASRLACIDVDMHAGGADGQANFARLLSEHGTGPFGATPADTRGHYFFAIPDGLAERWPTKIDLAPGVELLTGNAEKDHYVIVPPSEHRDGRPYRWIDGRDLRFSDPLPLPQWVIDAANRYVDEHESELELAGSGKSAGARVPITANLPRDEQNKLLDRARQYMSRVPGAVSGQGGHDHTLHAAGILVNGFGLSQSEALPILSDWNVSCQPPWKEADLRRKLSEAERLGPMAGKRRGHLADGTRPSPFRDLFADPEFSFSRSINAKLIRPDVQRATPEVAPAAVSVPSVLPLILAGATIGGERPRQSKVEEFAERPPGWEKVLAEMSQEEVEAALVRQIARDAERDRYNVYRCLYPRRIRLRELLVPQTTADRKKLKDAAKAGDPKPPAYKDETIIQTTACERPDCPGCWHRKRERMKRLGRFWLTTPTQGGPSQTVYMAELDLEPVAFRVRIARMRAASEDKSTFGKLGYIVLTADDGRRFAFTTMPNLIDDQPNFEQSTGAAASSRLASLIDALPPGKRGRIFSTSHNWKAPEIEDKDKLKRFDLEGVLPANLTYEMLEEGVRNLGCELQNVSSQFHAGPDRHVKAVLKFRHNLCGGSNWEHSRMLLLSKAIIPDPEWDTRYRPSDDESRLVDIDTPSDCERFDFESTEVAGRRTHWPDGVTPDLAAI